MKGTHRNSAAEGGQLPGATGGAHAHGLVIIVAVLMALEVAANPAEAVGARCGLPGQIPGLAAADAAAVTR